MNNNKLNIDQVNYVKYDKVTRGQREEEDEIKLPNILS
jgi:hypothetical protein